MEAVVFTGLQGSGKSSFYKERFFATHVRISLDLLRTRNRERRFLVSCLDTEQRFVIDNTNPTGEEASAQFSLRLGQAASFDCRVSQLPSSELVVDYFRWRNEDAARNALNSLCYWMLRKDGLNEQQATKRLLGLSVSQKNELLFQYDVNFNDIPSWQKRGVGLYWEHYDKPAINPVTKEEVVARRRRIRTEYDLPMKNEYGEFIRSILSRPRIQGVS